MDKLNILGQSLDTFRNNGFCNRTFNTLAHKDGRKTDGLLKKLVNMESRTSFSGTVQPLYILYTIIVMPCLKY